MLSLPFVSSCVVKDATALAKDSVRANIKHFTDTLPDVVGAGATTKQAFDQITRRELALFNPEQTTSWPNGGGSSALPQIFGLESDQATLIFSVIFTGQGQSGGGWTFDSQYFFVCAGIEYDGEAITLTDVDCPANAVRALPQDSGLTLRDVGVST
ncbi:hypothetical protein D9V28_03620 [Mycetocola zhadangensis]|uniref:Uncharacterized protein n=2 Tax=Mycetocola zhadangensis TaxID=1164595 RepID=A0A3L7J6G1_9MICO|nr:hypothetical protein D9V28_03620 [Mycetocola zhadangensis]GGE87146.1 hypothetical protein GCM10011313_07100 [Mycetocola zhadangensis]